MFKSNKQNSNDEELIIEKLKCSAKEEDFIEIIMNEQILKEEVLSSIIEDGKFYDEYIDIPFKKNNFLLKKSLDSLKIKLNSTINEFESFLVNKNEETSLLKNYIISNTKLNEENKSLNEDLYNLTEEFDSMTTKNNSLILENNDLKQAIEKLKKNYNETFSKINEENSSLIKKIDFFKTNINQFEENYDNIKQKNSSLITENKNLKTNINQLKENYDNIKQKNSSLIIENKNLKNDIDQLKKNYDNYNNVKDKNSSLITENKNLKNNINQLKENYDNTKDKNSSLIIENKNLKNNINQLKENYNNIKEKNNSLIAENKKHKKTFDKLYSDITDLENNILSLNFENTALKDQIERLDSENERSEIDALELSILKSNNKDLFELEKKLNNSLNYKIEKERKIFLNRAKNLSTKNDDIDYYTSIVAKYENILPYNLLDKLFAAEAIRSLINKESITDYSSGLSLYAGILEYMLSECIPKKCIKELKIETIPDKLNFLTQNAFNYRQWQYFSKEVFKYDIVFLRNKAQHGESINKDEYNKFIDFLFSNNISKLYESNTRFEFILYNLKYI